MKPDAVLINTSRGGLVDEQALLEAMSSGHLLGAGLDVFKTEPLPADSPLTKLKNILLTTHTAGLDEQSEIDMARFAAQNLADLYQGKWPEASVVNKELAGKWKW
jgi:phosphoglycerate dehydrogenase-like enzyme